MVLLSLFSKVAFLRFYANKKNRFFSLCLFYHSVDLIVPKYNYIRLKGVRSVAK